ncbi:MAG: HAD family phosphatase [Bacteroidota bacterium]|nr:HAD family phosphatase [Bacteroidota bacterium]
MIKNLIFDFGGVIINIDPRQAGRTLKEMGVKDMEQLHQKILAKGLYLDLEKGLITPSAFRKGIKELADIPLTDTQIDRAWNSIIVDLPKPRFDLIRQLKQNYNVYLLSNTNEIHYQYFNRFAIENLGVNSLEDFFTQCFFSHRMKLRKPDQEIFLKMLEIAKINPSESLYIDDIPENVQAARQVGLHGIVHHPDEEVSQYFVDGRIKD